MSELRGRPHVLKQVNSSLVMESLAEKGTATRGYLAEQTGLSQPTVNAIVNKLLQEGSVREMGFAVSNGGRRAQTYALDPRHACVLVLYLRPEHIAYRMVNAAGNILASGRQEVTAAHILDGLYAQLDALLANEPSVKAIGVGVPGAVSREGVVFAIPQISALENVPLQALLAARYPQLIAVENDMNVMALGYYTEVLRAQTEDVVHIHVGEGIGSGIVVAGQIVRGFSSFAGEISYMFTGADNAQTKTGQGPFETQLMQARTQDERAQVVAHMVVNIVCILNPPVLVFSGGNASAGLLGTTRGYCEQYIPPSAMPSFRIIGDENHFYFNGLVHIVRAGLDKDIKLVGGRA